MKVYLLFILLIFAFNLYGLQAQENEKLDSLLTIYENQKDDTLKVNILSQLHDLALYNAPLEAKRYAQLELELSEKLGFTKGTGTALHHMGVYYNNASQFDSAKYYYRKALEKFDLLQDSGKIADVNHGLAIIEYSLGNYNDALSILDKNIAYYESKNADSLSIAITYDFKGVIHTFLGNYNIALKEIHQALNILEELDDPIRKADAYNHLATAEFHLKNFDESLKYNEGALKIYQENDDTFYTAQAYNDIGNTRFYLGNYEEATNYLTKCVELSKAMETPSLEATALGNLGKCYSKLGEHKKAIQTIKNALAIVESIGSKNKIVEALNDLGMAYNRMDRPQDALSYIDRAIILADSIGAKENLRIGYNNRSESYALLGDYQASLENHKRFVEIQDKMFDETKSQQIEELRTIYETEKKEQQINIQSNEIALLRQEAKISRLQQLLLGGGLGLSLLVFGLAFYALRQKIKRNRLEKEKVDVELAFKKKELTTHALHLAKKNEVLEGLKQKARQLKENEASKHGYQQLIRTINSDLQDDNNWENFSRYFEEVHKDFGREVKSKYPELTHNELRLMALLKMNLSSKEIANILSISAEGIKKARYRLRKKLNITTDDSLEELVLNL